MPPAEGFTREAGARSGPPTDKAAEVGLLQLTGPR